MAAGSVESPARSAVLGGGEVSVLWMSNPVRRGAFVGCFTMGSCKMAEDWSARRGIGPSCAVAGDTREGRTPGIGDALLYAEVAKLVIRHAEIRREGRYVVKHSWAGMRGLGRGGRLVPRVEGLQGATSVLHFYRQLSVLTAV